MFVYDKTGKEFKVPHAIDRKEWIKTGNYFTVNPKAKKAPQKDTGK